MTKESSTGKLGQVDEHQDLVGVITESLGPLSGDAHDSLASSRRLDPSLHGLQDGSF